MKNIQIINTGSRRIVILFKNKAYKIPNFTKRWVSFLNGFLENLYERYWWSSDGSRKRFPNRKWEHKNLAEIYYADRFGFLVIMKRANTDFIKDEKFKRDYIELEKWANEYGLKDMSENNVGYIDDKLVIIDYGWFGGSMDCYIGT